MLAGTTRFWQSDTSLVYQTLLFLRRWAICQTNVTTYIAMQKLWWGIKFGSLVILF